MRLDLLAQDWIGTPFCEGGAQKGIGCDCLGLLIGTSGLDVPSYGENWRHVLGPEALEAGLAARFAPAEGPIAAGEILLFALRPRGPGCHIGIASKGGDAFLHAYGGRGVVQSPLSLAWLKRLKARYIFGE